MFKHPCSYLIYSRAFQELPRPMKDLIYRRLWEVLTASPAAAASLANGDASNGEKVEDSPTLNPSAAKYAHLSTADRRVIREILRDTKTDLPEYWK